MTLYPIAGNYTICSIKPLVCNEISSSSVKFNVRLNINYCEIQNSYKIYNHKTYKIYN